MRLRILLCAVFVPVLVCAQTQINGIRDWKKVTTPGNPAATDLRVWADTATGKLRCKDSAGADCLALVGGTTHTQNTDTGTTSACFQLANTAAGPKLCTDGAGGFSLKTASDVAIMTCTTAGACTYSGTGGAELQMFGLTSGSVTQSVPAVAGANIASWPAATGTVVLKYAAAFTSQTSITVSGSTHKLGTCDVGVVVYDTSTPSQIIEPDRVTCNQTTNDIVITFGAAQSGRYVIR